MRRSRFSESQIIGMLKDQEAVIPHVVERLFFVDFFSAILPRKFYLLSPLTTWADNPSHLGALLSALGALAKGRIKLYPQNRLSL